MRSTNCRVALLCSGLGNVHRGHEVFARDLFALLSADLDITLFKGNGPASAREIVVDHVPRSSKAMDGMHLAVAPKWRSAAEEVERMRIEGETFAYGALRPLLEGNFDILHCLEQEVARVLYAHRHLFARPPKVLWSNGGALQAADIPPCDFVQEHTEYNLRGSARGKAFVIPHGVDTSRFHPDVASNFRQQHGIPADAFVVISVGTICYWHKRMDYVIREVAQVPGAWLVIVGQDSPDAAAIRALGRELMPGRIVITTLAHDQLPQAYAAANVFALGSLFETFGIVYIEAMAMGLPVFCTKHPNQKSIVQEGVFIDMLQPGRLAQALREAPPKRLAELGQRGVEIVKKRYELGSLKAAYLGRYAAISASQTKLPRYSFKTKMLTHVRKGADALHKFVIR